MAQPIGSIGSDYTHSGSTSARAMNGDTYLTSDDIDTSGAQSINVGFWYRDHLIDDNDNVNLQFYNGTNWRTIFELGNSIPEDEWHHYSVDVNEPKYMRTDFRMRFAAGSFRILVSMCGLTI